MNQSPADSSGRSSALRHCACCGAEVVRRDCHKNRYGEYICKSCQAAGKRCSRRYQILGLWRPALRGIAYLLGALVALAVLYKAFSIIASRFA